MTRVDPLISLADYERAAEGLLEPICLSTFADVGVSELAQAAPESSRWFQLYVFRDRAPPSLAWVDIERFASELDTALALTGVARAAALDRDQLGAAPWAAEL